MTIILLWRYDTGLMCTDCGDWYEIARIELNVFHNAPENVYSIMYIRVYNTERM